MLVSRIPAHMRVALTAMTALLSIAGRADAAVRQSPSQGDSSITVEDAIRMVRIGDRAGLAVFSPDGSKLATVVWRGDLEQNANIYSLLVFDMRQAIASPRATYDPVLSIPFHGDTVDVSRGPIEQLHFLADNVTVTFLGTLAGEPEQVYAVNTKTGDVRPLTRHPTPVRAYSVTLDGRVRMYAAVTPDSADSARLQRLRSDGFSPDDRSLFGNENLFRYRSAVRVLQAMAPREGVAYFAPQEDTGEPTRITDAAQIRERMASAPSGRGAPVPIPPGLNARQPVVSNGRVAVGVIDSLTVPPEFAAIDLGTGTITVLTNLNPALRGRRYGEVEQLVFSTPFDSVNTGWLIKPVGFEPGRRYPLLVLHADEPERPRDRSYLLDGRHNLSGHAAQPLAALGFMVLYIGAPPSSRPGARTEIETVRASIEEAIRALARRGYVDTLRVGVSGWSRSGWFVEQLLVHSRFPFAAATLIDGGTAVYNEGNRPYSDAELERISTPVLIEPHGLIMFATASVMRDRMRALGKAVDLLYFPNAPHATRQPRQRWRSLTTHVDWWRFWLQGHEDPDPSKAEQYRRWRALVRR